MRHWGAAMFGRKSQDGGTLPPQPAAGGGLAIDVEDVNPETPETPGHRRTGSGGWLSPGKSGKKRPKRTLTTPRKGEVKQNLYEPPNLEKALARMRRLQPHEETDDPEKPTKKLPLWMKEEEMQGKFSEGIVFWFKLMRDHLLMFFIFTILSFWAFNQMRVSNEEANPSYERLGALGRVTLAAIMIWSEDTQRKGETVSNTDKDATFGIIVLDALMMFALLFVTGYHHMKKEQVKEEVDDATISLDDYSVVIESGLPSDVTEERIRAHFEKFGEVHEVVLGKDLLEVMNLRKRLIALEANHEMLEWMLKRANKLLGIVEMDTSNMTQEEIAVARWKKLTRRVKKEIDKREGRVDVFFAALEKARDDSLSIEDRAAAAADAASKNPRFAGGKDNAGAAASKDPSNYNPAVIKQKIEQSLKDREELEDEIAACVEEGYPVVTAWVAFEEEDSCVECVQAVRASKKRERKIKAKKLVGLEETDGLPGEYDVRTFEGENKLEISTAPPPSDILWENLHYSMDTFWKREMRSNVIMWGFLIINVFAIAGAKITSVTLPPVIPVCDDVDNGGSFLQCPKLWNLDSDTAAVASQARIDIMPFVKQEKSASNCEDFLEYDQFIGNMTKYANWYDGTSVAAGAPTTAAEVATFRAGIETAGAAWTGGFDQATHMDECAAQICYSCYCKKNTADEFCKEHNENEAERTLILIGAICVSATANLIIKELAIRLSFFERPHSTTARELGIAEKMTVALMVNMCLLPLLMTTQLAIPSWPGKFDDTSSGWYNDFGNTLVQIALINSISFPFTLLSPVIIWRMLVYFLTPSVKSQRQLNELWTPPPFLLSERYGQMNAAFLYTIIFSSGMPLLYVGHFVKIALDIVIDRIMLFRACVQPPRYTGKLAAQFLYIVPIGIILHFLFAVYMCGERDLPSRTLPAGVFGKWAGGPNQAVAERDDQFDFSARLKRVNGLFPFVCAMVTAGLVFIATIVLQVRKRKKKGQMEAEGCPPLSEAKAKKLITDLTSYRITDNPVYQHLFPPGEEVSEGL